MVCCCLERISTTALQMQKENKSRDWSSSNCVTRAMRVFYDLNLKQEVNNVTHAIAYPAK